MSERPILFSGPMVRAILAGRKTQTRRLAGKRKPPAVGDVLWVRETWVQVDEHHPPGVAYRADVPDEREERAIRRIAGGAPWCPSIFMPRWACRLKLLVTDVRHQRLQDISEEDARAEGFTSEPSPMLVNGKAATGVFFAPKLWFAHLWNAINGERAPWASNPEVHAITFAPLEKP